MGEEILKTLVPLVSVLVGALVVHLSNARLDRNRRKVDARTLAGMLAAEIDTTIRHAERRNYEGHYRQYLARFKSGDFSEMPGIRGLDDKLPDIAAASINRLGLLDPELSRDVVLWYGSLRGIKIDLLELGSCEIPQNECVSLLSEVLNIWTTDLKGTAPILIQKLRRV